MDEQKLNKFTEKIIGCAYAVGNNLGNGFLEKVYENAFAYELRETGLKAEQQKPIKVFYKGKVVGEYVADLVIEDCVLIELKTVKNLDEVHLAQCLNYLKATDLPICLLINFGKPKVAIRRIYLSTNLRNIFK